MGYAIQTATTTAPIVFGPVVLTSDHLSPATGKTLVVTISKNGAAFASPAGTVSEIGAGFYKIAGNATDNATAGPLVVDVASGASWDAFDDVFQVVSYNPYDAVRLGLTAMPNAAAAATGGLPTVDASNAVKLQSGTAANQLSLAAGLVTAGTVSDKTGYALSSGGVQAVWDALTSALTTSGSIGKKLLDWMTGASAQAAADAAITANAAIGGHTTSLAAIKSVTDSIANGNLVGVVQASPSPTTTSFALAITAAGVAAPGFVLNALHGKWALPQGNTTAALYGQEGAVLGNTSSGSNVTTITLTTGTAFTVPPATGDIINLVGAGSN